MCLTLVSAGIITEIIISEKYEETHDLTTIQESRIKSSSNIDKIDITISATQCNNIECYAKISQPNVINTEWRRDKSYCSKYSICEDEKDIDGIDINCEIVCLTYTDYTTVENQNAIKEFIEERLENYADAEETRKGSVNGVYEDKDVGGSLTDALVVEEGEIRKWWRISIL